MSVRATLFSIPYLLDTFASTPSNMRHKTPSQYWVVSTYGPCHQLKMVLLKLILEFLYLKYADYAKL